MGWCELKAGNRLKHLSIPHAPMNYAIHLLGLVIYLAGTLWMLSEATDQGLLWGLAIFVFPCSLLFVIRHWQDAKGPFFTQAAGFSIMLLPTLF